MMLSEEVVEAIKKILDTTPLYVQTKLNTQTTGPVQYVGIHVLRWKMTFYPEPECGFIEATAVKDAIRKLLEELVEVF